MVDGFITKYSLWSKKTSTMGPTMVLTSTARRIPPVTGRHGGLKNLWWISLTWCVWKGIAPNNNLNMGKTMGKWCKKNGILRSIFSNSKFSALRWTRWTESRATRIKCVQSCHDTLQRIIRIPGPQGQKATCVMVKLHAWDSSRAPGHHSDRV